ncbi:hypothetical protein GCM10007079_48420 [Nocardiopsis terrae]|uniref:Ig-like domain-containing protein n=1 Tax=Nocardiopsis terrae TaxID=372655 RepID=A0ABR9HAV7_9ACTN|nr:hypothetical protein [Nocardiopsis terrae]MBE1456041.1 hypothetical protein [Nocardiopsis terrae]GHC96177.1 hypothetical protein GCM10007079_48420 [Nocardiopsis terrae]
MQPSTRALLPLAASGLALALTACGGDGTSELEPAPEVDTAGFTYGEVPTENTKGPSIDESLMPPEPAPGTPRHERNAHTALVQVSELTWTADPDATAECPEVDLHAEGSYTCVVTYFGEEFEYLVELDEERSTADYAAEEARLVTGPIIVENLEHDIRVWSLMPYVDCGLEGEVVAATDGEEVTCTALDDETGATEEYLVTYSVLLGYSIEEV